MPHPPVLEDTPLPESFHDENHLEEFLSTPTRGLVVDFAANLADDPKYQSIKYELAGRLARTLIERKDPRALGHGEIFNNHVILPGQR